jgi:hypothetical protein
MDMFYVQGTHFHDPGHNRANKGHVLKIWDIKGAYLANL